ncbi:MAG TPA: ABC transporter substrate-binding protein, partial [Lachnospiraceae bacterium]|nr:ABC transporter substrate-binding protein [Lachnospiraceae bacterium]
MFYFDENNEVQCGLATSFEAVDTTTYVMGIRDDVYFSTGEPMTVDDVIYSLDRMRNPDNASKLLFMFDYVDSIEQTGDWEVTIKLTQGDANFQYALATSAGLVISKKWAEEIGEENIGSVEDGIIGTGPYVYGSRTVGSEVVLEKNENWWNKDASVDIDEVRIEIIPDVNSRALALKSGQIDYTPSVSESIMEEVMSYDNITYNHQPGYTNKFITFNTEHTPLDNKLVRQAICCSVDWDAIYESLYSEVGEKCGDKFWGAASDITDAFDSYTPDNRKYTYDVEKAKELLTEAGYPDGFETTISYRTNDPKNETFALAMQQYMSEVGITATLVSYSYPEFQPLHYGYTLAEDGTR